MTRKKTNPCLNMGIMHFLKCFLIILILGLSIVTFIIMISHSFKIAFLINKNKYHLSRITDVRVNYKETFIFFLHYHGISTSEMAVLYRVPNQFQ